MDLSCTDAGPPRAGQSPSAPTGQSKTRNRIRNGQVVILFGLWVEGVGVWSGYGPYSPSQGKAQVGVYLEPQL